MGTYGTDYNSTYNTEHSDKGVLPKDHQREKTMKDLRTHHYSLGHYGDHFKTSN